MMDILDENTPGSGGNTISPAAKQLLHKSAVWVKTLAIISIVFNALGILGGIFTLAGSLALGAVYIILYGIGIYISVLLLKISNGASQATYNIDSFADNFYKFYKITAILTIIIISLVIILAIIIATSGEDILYSIIGNLS